MLVEALQMLKYNLKKCRLIFSEEILDQHSLMDDEPDKSEHSTAVHSLSQDDAVDAIVGHVIREECDHMQAEIVLFDS
jgi:hypothetical protein